MLEKASELIRELAEKVADTADDSGTTTTTTSRPSRTASTRSTGSAPTTGPMLNANTSSWMDLQHYRKQLTPDEFSTLKDSPVCFFAHMEALYKAYADYVSSTSSKSTSKTATSSSPSDTVTAAPAFLKRNPTDCLEQPDLASCTEAASSESSESAATALYLSYLPSQISLVYLSTPTSLQVTATSTTSCARLGNMTAFETTYALFGYRDGFSAPSTRTSTNTPLPTLPTFTPTTSNDESTGGAGSRWNPPSLSFVVGATLAGLLYAS